MRAFVVSLLLWNLASLASSTGESRFVEQDKESLDIKNEDPCVNVLCHAGQECVVVDSNTACVCRKSCPDHENPVCGSNGMTFPNHCELHRTSCLERKKIAIKYDGECKGQPTQPPLTPKNNQWKPIVCYEHDRDEIRNHLIGWLKNQNKSPELLNGYRNLLQSYFDMMDENDDGKLDATEFREFVSANQSVTEIVSSDEYKNPVLQNLCADALLSLSDEDSDWELNITEFMRCLDPQFKPPKKGCELDSEVYSDGSEIPTDCNSCVCACGNWICTALKCDGKESNQPGAETSEDDVEKETNKFIVKGSKAKEQLTKEIIKHDQRERIHLHEKKVLPLHKPRHHHRNKKHGNYGLRENGHSEN